MSTDARKRVHAIAVELFGDDVGCSDRGCVFGHPGGMHTNGGCQHLKTRDSSELRRTVQMLSRIAIHFAEQTDAQVPATSAPLQIDPKRVYFTDTGEILSMYRGTGIFVRAKLPSDSRWKNADIVTLDKSSLIAWLRSRGEKNEWAESVVLALLDHDREAEGVDGES